MFPALLSERLDALIDDLIREGGVESASLASILLAARDSVGRNDSGRLSLRVWAANNELRHDRESAAGRPAPPTVVSEGFTNRN